MTVIFAEDLRGKSIDATNCPVRADGYYDEKKNGINTFSNMDNLHDPNFTYNPAFFKNGAMENIPICDANFFSDSAKDGCCYIDDTTSSCEKLGKKNNSIGLSLLMFNDSKVDSNGKPSSIDKKEICHREEVQSKFSSISNNPNKMVNFLTLLGVAIFTIAITAILGCCYEFWLKYGNARDCLYYKSKFSNIGPHGNKASLIQYIYPASICYYPYQEGSSRSKGLFSGGGFMDDGEKTNAINSKFKESVGSGIKCVNVYEDIAARGGKVFPYNVADIDIDNQFLKMPLKAFSFYFLYMVLIARFCFNKIMNYLSQKYNQHIANSPAKTNFIFLILSGLILNLVAILPIPIDINLSFLHAGPMYWISLALSLAMTTFMNPMLIFLLATILTIIPEKLIGKRLAACNLSSRYYRVYAPTGFYPIRDPILSLSRKILNVVLNLLLIIPWLIMILITIFTGLLGIIFATIYLNFSILFNTFYIPLSNTTEFMDLLANHGDLLTILFCATIVGSSYFSKFDTVTTGTMGGILFILIIYKLLKGMRRGMR